MSASADQVRELWYAAADRASDLDCLLAYIEGRFPDELADLLRRVVADGAFVSPTAAALLAKLGR